MQNIENYFASPAAMYVFILLHTDGKVRNDLLGITDDMYGDRDKAISWYKSIITNLVQFPIMECANEAIRILYNIFRIMTDDC